MATSLSEQLRRLAVPQTTVLSDARRRVSVLFEPKVAATKDRRTIYELGVSGLQELMAINSYFKQFEATLFNEETIHLERAVEKSDVNELLDSNIEKFLHFLSPYFLLRPAHLCIEWLLRRFQVNEYNRTALLALALPYHDTKAFVRVFQTIRLKKSEIELDWLRPLQKPGLPLPKTAIINRAATDAAFLKLICKWTLNAVRDLGIRAHLLQAQLNFYTVIVVGALEHASEIKEWHVITLLPSIIEGFGSEAVDFVSATYIVTAQLVGRTKLKQKLSKSLIKRVAAVNFERLRTPAVLLLIWIFETQDEERPHISKDILQTIVQADWFTVVFAAISNDNTAVKALYIPLLRAAVKAIMKGSNKDIQACKNFLVRLLNDVKLDNDAAQDVINCFLDAFVVTSTFNDNELTNNVNNNFDVIVLDSDTEMTNIDESFQKWYSHYLRDLERKYPTAFDLAIKESLKNNNDENSNRNVALKMALGFRLKSYDENASNIYENLYHHTAKIRLFAVKTLIENLEKYQTNPQNYELLKECLADRITDDSELIVSEILRLPTEDFINILGHDQFVQHLFQILYKTQFDPQRWSQLTHHVINHLTSHSIVLLYDANVLLLALMPLLFPADNSHANISEITKIVKSPLADKLKFLKSLHIDPNNESNAAEYKKHFLDVIAQSNDTPTVLELLKSVHTQANDFLKQPTQFANFLLMATACIKNTLDGVESLQVFEQVIAYCARFEIKHLPNKISQLDSKESFVPLQLFSDFITTLTKRTQFKKILYWKTFEPDLRCLVNIIDFVTRRAFSEKNTNDQNEWLTIIKDIFGYVFKGPQAKIEFLTNFFVFDNLNFVDNYTSLRVIAFKLLNAVLRNKQNKSQLSAEDVLKIVIAFNSPIEIIRTEALGTLTEVLKYASINANLKMFLESILERNYEIRLDHEQFPLMMYTILKPTQKQKAPMSAYILREILKILTGEKPYENVTFTAALLQVIKHLNDEEVLGALLPLALRALEQVTNENSVKLLTDPYVLIYQSTVLRFDCQTIEPVLVDIPAAWKFIEKIFNSYDVFLALDGKLQPVPCLFVDNLDEITFDKIPSKFKIQLIQLIVRTVAVAENDTIFLSCNKLLKKCELDCKPLVPILTNMHKNAVQENTKLRKPENLKKLNGNSVAWKEGVVLLELLENKKKLTGVAHIIPALFELLKVGLESENHGSVEYTKQLTLSALLHCCQTFETNGNDLQTMLPKTSFRIDQIVQCVRTTQNPQTHHNALLLLSHCAKLFPQQVLHNIVDIFTFMGSSVVRQDDAFSFQIINNIIESIVPILVKSKTEPSNANNITMAPFVIPVLKVFSDIMLDVPEHRRLPLYTKLIRTLGPEEYFCKFLCVVFEAHVIEDEKERLVHKKNHTRPPNNTDKLPRRIEIALNLVNAFTPQIILDTCIQLMHYVSNLPLTKETAQESANKRLYTSNSTEVSLFNVKCRTAKELRHYKYVIMQFLATLTSSAEFLKKIALFSDEEMLAMKPFYQNFIINTLSFVPVVNAAIEKAEDALQTKFWKIILHHLHDILDNTISLLSPDMFLVVVNKLMQHQLLSIRKRVIELLINKLQLRDTFFDSCDEQNFYNLLKPLSEIVDAILQKHDAAAETACPTNSSNELVFLQQTALIAIKLLSRMFALKHIDEFKSLLVNLTKITKKRTNVPKIVLATVVLTMIEISANLKAHSLAQLPKYMPYLIELLEDQAELTCQQPPDNICLALTASIQKLFESLPLFLGPYIVKVITLLSRISTNIVAQQLENDQRVMSVLQKISIIWTRIATDVPLRILMPGCTQVYKKMTLLHNYDDITALMQLLSKSISNAEGTDLTNMQTELSQFFMCALQFRAQVEDTQFERKRIATIENSTIDTFVTWVLKLSESFFRPMYHEVYLWAIKDTAQKSTILTFFLLTNKIAQALKSLFVLFARDFIKDAAKLLGALNSAKTTIDTNEVLINTDLLKAILDTLHNVFLYDTKRFIDLHYFEVLMQPIVDQFENSLVLENELLQNVLTSCIAQLAVSVSSDSSWKQLNYQVLLKTRSNVPEVRILSFNCCVEIARKLGEDFTTLLPETVPFIAELFEDENARVEKNTRKSVQELESILGDSIQKYL